MGNRTFIELENSMKELDRMVSWLENTAEEWGFQPMFTLNLNLVLEEAFSNIVNYAYTDTNKHLIEIGLEMHDPILTVQIADDGRPYDPTLNKDPDLTLPVEQREIGGLGIYLIKQVMDQVTYERSGNKNRLILTKAITRESDSHSK